MKIERDQTAERTFAAGLKAIAGRIGELRKTNVGYTTTAEYSRLSEDKIGILVSLKGLHQTYKATEKLQEVERELKEMGYTK